MDQAWRRIINTYGCYSASDIAQLRGAAPDNRSIASRMQRTHGLLGVKHGRAMIYPRFQFEGREVRADWKKVTGPLVEAGWGSEDVLLWLAAPNGALHGASPVDTLDRDPALVADLAANEASGIW